MTFSETCDRIISLVKDYELKGGITKNEVCRILTQKYGGSRGTYWKCFDALLEPDSGNEIELKVVPPNKQLAMLFPTDKNKQVNIFRTKLEKATRLIDLVEQTPLIGDCYENEEEEEENLKPSFGTDDPTVEAIRKDRDPIPVDPDCSLGETTIYTLQARHDILEKMSLFLVNYISDNNNKFSDHARKECMEIMTPLMIRVFGLLQKDYSYSRYCSNTFYENQMDMTFICLAKGKVESDIAADFLVILGRYYFLTEKDFSDKTLDIFSNVEHLMLYTLGFDINLGFDFPNLGTSSIYHPDNYNWSPEESIDY